MDNAKKKRIKKYLSWILLAALVAGLAVMPLLAQSEEEENGPSASILEDTVRKASVSTAIHGGGTLEAGNAMDITLPSGVKITEFLVKNGQSVSEGEPVAAVDKVSVMNAIVEVRESMDYLQRQITDAGDDTVSDTIRATAGGLVKQVFAQKDDSVRDVMLRHGALAVLSLDGRMAVDISKDVDLAAGDTVCVTLDDNTEVDGRVESNLDGTVVITIEDDGYAVGETVTVTDEDGSRIGSGALYVHNAWSVTAFSGTVSRVYAQENREVSPGATLFRLEDTDFTGNLESLSNLHREYEQLLQELFQMYETGVITAPCGGQISGVDADSAFLLGAAGEYAGWTIQLLSGDAVCTGREDCPAGGSHTIENCPKNVCNGKTDCPANPDKHAADCLSHCENKQGCIALAHAVGCPEICTGKDDCQAMLNANHLEDCPRRCTGKSDCSAAYHVAGCLGKCSETAYCKACLQNHTENCPFYCDKTESCDAPEHLDGCLAIKTLTYTGYVGVVSRVEPAGKVLYLYLNKTEGAQVTYTNKWDYGTLNVKNPTGLVPDNATPYYYTDGTFAAGDIVVVAFGEDGSYVVSNTGNKSQLSGQGGAQQGQPGSMDLSGILGSMGGLSGMTGSFGSMGSFGGFGGGAGTAQETELFDLKGQVLMTVTEREVMLLTITVDERDVARVSQGMTAEVKVAALKGQTFEAEITDIGMAGTNNGGSSKFTVELTMPLAEQMLAGMNATATIPLYTKPDVLTVPVAALVETEEGTFVCTAVDPETGEPANPAAVETGLSDGENVEILAGLNMGDRIFYSYYDTLELDHTAKSDGFSFG